MARVARAASGATGDGLVAVAAWTVVSTVVLGIRLLQGVYVRSRDGELRSWLAELDEQRGPVPAWARPLVADLAAERHLVHSAVWWPPCNHPPGASIAIPLTQLPVLAVLAGGTTNSTARNVGYGRAPLAALRRLLATSAAGVLPVPWSVMRCSGPTSKADRSMG